MQVLSEVYSGREGEESLGQGENCNREKRLDGSERGANGDDGGDVGLLRCIQGWQTDCLNLKTVRGDDSPHSWQVRNHRFWGLE